MVANTKVVESLNKQVANWNIMYVKLHNFHWFVKGPHFFTLHEKFEEYYNDASVKIDELAERILTIGGTPAATLKEYLELTSLKEATGKESAEQMVQAIIADFTTLRNECKEGAEVAEEAQDEASADMFKDIQGELEKHIWMLNAYLGK
ncbi:Dps family protein [Brevibacillus daliensis]|uniref:Dps family protein n=1 Tax=Brevibacillus daliensis TaxID=2892995 RepID=UPI0035A197A4